MQCAFSQNKTKKHSPGNLLIKSLRETFARDFFCSPTQSIVNELLNKRIRRWRKKRFKSFQHSSSEEAYRKKFSFVPIIISKFNCELTFLNHPNVVTGGRASARHFKVTFSPSALVMFRDGSSFAKCTETVGGSAGWKSLQLWQKFCGREIRKYTNMQRLSSSYPRVHHSRTTGLWIDKWAPLRRSPPTPSTSVYSTSD